ncbi:hypothetical protein QS423_09295 [Staphylococcus pseudintermedius]|nr:hypothetical protein QS423_09295 [Staphylococcus pseudintermedius]
MTITIREVSINDVEALTTLMQQVFEESEYMLYDPGFNYVSTYNI